ncbi:MAG: hypothetical protein WBP13_06955 [Methylophilaceae bacterium]
MIQRQLLSFVFILLFAFAQQEVMVHPYVHLTNVQESTSRENFSKNKQSPTHSDICGICVALAGIDSAVSSQAFTFLTIPTSFERSTEVAVSFISAPYLNYRSRAPPSLA